MSCLLTGILAFPQEAIVNATDGITSYEIFIEVS